MAIKVGLSEADVQTGLLFTIPPNSVIDAQIVIDIDHVISGTFCHYKVGEKEIIWAYSGESDPCHSLDISPRFSVIVPAILKQNKKKSLQYVRGPKQFQRALLTLDNRFGSIKGLLVKFGRKDDKFAHYSIEPTGKTAPLDDHDQDEIIETILDDIYSGTSEEIAEWLESILNRKISLPDNLEREEM